MYVRLIKCHNGEKGSTLILTFSIILLHNRSLYLLNLSENILGKHKKNVEDVL